MTENEVLAAALDYEGRGWSVLPLCPHNHLGVGRAHRGCASPGKRPFFPDRADGASGEWKEFQSRRATADEIRVWWDKNPFLNVGLALGPVSGLVGIDVDDEDGDTLLAELAGGDLPETLEYTTGKGRRLLYRLPPGVVVVSQAFKRPGTEIEILRFMGQGGQVVLPPSTHPNKSLYRWVAGRGPADRGAADVPGWLRGEAKNERATATRPADGELITEGGRNNYLISLAGAMRKRGADEATVLAALRATNDGRFDPPLSEHEVEAVARSAMRYAPDEFTGVTMKVTVPGAAPAPNTPTGEYERRFKWASELAAPPKADDWIWEGYLPRGAAVLFSALWKVGKTTLLTHLLRAFAAGGDFLGRPIRAAKVLYVSEENERHWVRRRDELGIGNHVGFYLTPFPTRATADAWLSFVNGLRRDVETHGFDLVVFDTLSKLWPVTKENDAGEVDGALMPLTILTKTGAAVLLIHHLRKSGGQEYTGSRGSGALSAFPDIIVELTRFDASDPKCRKRKLNAMGRYEETPQELVIEMTEGGYVVVPEHAPPAAPDVVPFDGRVFRVPPPSAEEGRVLSVLETWPDPWLQSDDIREGLRLRGDGMRSEDVVTHLSSLYHRKQIVMRGRLRSKTEPRQWALPSRVDLDPSSSALRVQVGNETEADGETDVA